MDPRSSRALRTASGLVLAVVAGLLWWMLRVPSAETSVSPAGVAREPAPSSEPASVQGIRGPASSMSSEATAANVADAVPDEDRGLADVVGRLDGLELPHEYRDVRVALWSDTLRPDCATLAAAGEDTLPMRVVAAAPDGSFRFAGLPADGSFRLLAGGAAHVSAPLERPVQPSAELVLLHLSRVKGLEIELVGSDGLPPRTHPDLVLQGSSFEGSALVEPGALLEPWEERLAAIPGAGCDVPEPRLGARFLLRGPPELSALGPIGCHFDVVGYARASRVLWADPVAESIPRTRVELEPTTQEWGSLEARFEGWVPAIRDAVAADAFVGSVQVAYADGTTLQLPVRGGVASLVWDGIPSGRAEASFRSALMYRWPRDGSSVPLEIAERAPTLSVDLSESGAMRIALAPGEPDPFLGTGRILYLRRTSNRGLVSLGPLALPAFLPLIEPGEWSLVEMSRGGKRPTLTPSEGVRVLAAEITELVLATD